MCNKEKNSQIATTILSQIGSRALYMIGANTKIAIENGVRFKIMRHPLYNLITIKVNGMDTYDMDFEKWHNGKLIRKESRNGLYDDMLTRTIGEVTKLATSL